MASQMRGRETTIFYLAEIITLTCKMPTCFPYEDGPAQIHCRRHSPLPSLTLFQKDALLVAFNDAMCSVILT